MNIVLVVQHLQATRRLLAKLYRSCIIQLTISVTIVPRSKAITCISWLIDFGQEIKLEDGSAKTPDRDSESGLARLETIEMGTVFTSFVSSAHAFFSFHLSYTHNNDHALRSRCCVSIEYTDRRFHFFLRPTLIRSLIVWQDP